MKEIELLEVIDETKVLGKSVKLYRSIENPLFEAKVKCLNKQIFRNLRRVYF
jgi:hypothetical protein